MSPVDQHLPERHREATGLHGHVNVEAALGGVGRVQGGGSGSARRNVAPNWGNIEGKPGALALVLARTLALALSLIGTLELAL